MEPPRRATIEDIEATTGYPAVPSGSRKRWRGRLLAGLVRADSSPGPRAAFDEFASGRELVSSPCTLERLPPRGRGALARVDACVDMPVHGFLAILAWAGTGPDAASVGLF